LESLVGRVQGLSIDKNGDRSGSRFKPAGIAAILRSHGFCAIQDINFQEIASGSAAPFKDSRRDTLEFMLSTLSTN
jgi:hypothetical protein